MSDGGLNYPCAYPVKVFLQPDVAHEAALVARVRAELAADAPLDVERRASSAGRYVCLTLRLTVQSAAQAERIAAVVRAADGVLMSL